MFNGCQCLVGVRGHASEVADFGRVPAWPSFGRFDGVWEVGVAGLGFGCCDARAPATVARPRPAPEFRCGARPCEGQRLRRPALALLTDQSGRARPVALRLVTALAALRDRRRGVGGLSADVLLAGRSARAGPSTPRTGARAPPLIESKSRGRLDAFPETDAARCASGTRRWPELRHLFGRSNRIWKMAVAHVCSRFRRRFSGTLTTCRCVWAGRRVEPAPRRRQTRGRCIRVGRLRWHDGRPG